jgi:phosphate/sulfate permease
MTPSYTLAFVRTNWRYVCGLAAASALLWFASRIISVCIAIYLVMWVRHEWHDQQAVHAHAQFVEADQPLTAAEHERVTSAMRTMRRRSASAIAPTPTKPGPPPVLTMH